MMKKADSEKIVRVSNVQRFCVHDGPGIRTTVFFKECNLHCPWCSNPECQSYEIQNFEVLDKHGYGTQDHYGYDITLGELHKILLKDKKYYGNDGGVTFSGGEPLLHLDRYAELIKELRADHVMCACETALFIDEDTVKEAADMFDLFIVDLKTGLNDFAINILGSANVSTYLDNLRYISKRKKLWIRFPAIEDFTLKKENIDSICKVLSEVKYDKFQVLLGHNLGEKKYTNLHMNFIRIAESDLKYLKKCCESKNIKYEVLKV